MVDDLIKHIERHEKHPLVRQKILGYSSFTGSVEAFYDLSTWKGVIGFGRATAEGDVYELREEDRRKRGKYPKDLIQLVQPFAEQVFPGGQPIELDPQRLIYEKVRNDYKKRNSFTRNYITPTLGAIGFLGGLGCVSVGIMEAILGDNSINELSYGLIALGLPPFLASTYMFFKGLSKPKGTNDELKEYHKLHDAAQFMDNVIVTDYNDVLVRRALNN